MLKLPMNVKQRAIDWGLASLTDAQRAAFNQLHDCSPGPASSIGIINTNGFRLGESDREDAGVFPISSRFRNSCVPNCSHL